MIVREMMTKPVVSIASQESIGVAVSLMQDGGFRRLPVVDDDRLVGIVTDRDLRLATNSPLVLREKWYSNFLSETIKIKACMTEDPIIVEPETPVLEAVKLMRKHKVGGLPVLAGGEGMPIGIVTTTDVLDFLIQLLETSG